MRKYLVLLLALMLLCPVSASATGPKYIGLTFEGVPSGEAGRTLLDGLTQRKVRATFFLWAGPWEWGRRILDSDHEIGLLVPESLNRMSRREAAAKLRGVQTLMPPCRIRYLFSPGGCSDGLRQVAAARGLSLLDTPFHPWTEAPGGKTLLERLQTGDTLCLRAATPADVTLALNLIDLLQAQGFRLVTASELGRLQRESFDSREFRRYNTSG